MSWFYLLVTIIAQLLIHSGAILLRECPRSRLRNTNAILIEGGKGEFSEFVGEARGFQSTLCYRFQSQKVCN